jgi:hypothetical protein
VAKEAKASSKRQKEINTEVAKERLAEMEVDESFAQREETQQHIRQQSDVEEDGTSNSDDKETKFPDLANSNMVNAEYHSRSPGVSDDDTEGNNDTSDDDNQGSSQKKSKASIC